MRAISPAYSLLLTACASALHVACFSERTSEPQIQPDVLCSVSIGTLLQGGAYVPMRGYAYLADTVRVPRGTRVTWVNCEAAAEDPHTITSDAGVWDSPFVSVGATFSRTFDVPGTFPYHCIPHPSMQAVVIVE